jgi:hypothetical protein
MKKITLKTVQPPRKLVAVIGCSGAGMYVLSGNNKARFIGQNGPEFSPSIFSLEELLLKDSARQAVYEGDTIEIQF